MIQSIKQQMFSEHQLAICKLCEELIIGGPSMTSTFLCEGRFCDRALEIFIESSETCETCMKLIPEGTGDSFTNRSDGYKFWLCEKCIELGDYY